MVLFWLVSICFPSFWTSCDVAQSSTLHLASPDAAALIFSAEILDSVFYSDNEFPDRCVVTVSVKERFAGDMPASTLTLLWDTGERPSKGEQWLVFTQLHRGRYFAGGRCNETTRLDTAAYTQAMLSRLRLFRDARMAPGYNPVVARHFFSDKIAAKGAFSSGKPVGEWVHYYANGNLWALFRFDSSGQKHGHNDYIYENRGLIREHYVHGFRDTTLAFGDAAGRVMESKTIFRNTSAGNLEEYTMEYDTSGKMTCVAYLLLSDGAGNKDTGAPRVLASGRKIFDPPVSADSIYGYDPESGVWQGPDKRW